MLNGISTKALIDSGSVSNLMGMRKYEELKAQGLDVKLENCHKRLYAYGGKELNVVGQIQVELSVGTKKINSQFVVTTSGRCLLGHTTSRDLGLLRIGFSSSDKVSKGLQWNWQAKRVQTKATRGSGGNASNPEAKACPLCLV